MKKLGVFLFSAFYFICPVMAVSSDYKDPEITFAVNRMIGLYPASTLQDIYKSFFQDRFGPGHLVSDTTEIEEYLRREIAGMPASGSLPLLEPTGCGSHFYRVNLSLVRDGVIPFAVFFDAFVRSIDLIQPPAIACWAQEWQQITTVIDSLKLDIVGYENDKKQLMEMLDGGDYIVHHSDTFLQNYALHYRIIDRTIVEREWGILLTNKSNILQ